MSRVKLLFCVLMLAVTTACSWVQPFVDRRRNAGAPVAQRYVGKSTKSEPVICYNGWVTEYDELKKMADEECIRHQTGDYAEPEEQEFFVCRIFTPASYRFKCVKKEEAERTEK